MISELISMDWLFFLLIGAVFISIEILVFNFAFGWLLFLGLAAWITALVTYFLPVLDFASASAIFVITSVSLVIFLFHPLRKWQLKHNDKQLSSFIGKQVKVVEAVSVNQPGLFLFLGVHGKQSWMIAVIKRTSK